MNTVDIGLVVLYLIVTLIIGYKSGQNVKTMKEFSVAGKTLPTAALVATYFATAKGGDDIMGTGEVCVAGIIFVCINFAQVTGILLWAYVIAPKVLKNFSDKISLGEIMGELYGNVGRVVTGIATAGISMGRLALQISCLGYVCSMTLGIPYGAGVLIGSAVVVFYSAYGGVRSVVATDVLQFWILIVAIPIMANLALYKVGGLEVLVSNLPDFYFSLFHSNDDFWYYVGVLVVFAVPCFSPTVVQRLLMARDIKQAKQVLVIGAGLHIPFYVALGIIALCSVVSYPSCEPNMVFLTVLDKSLPHVVKGLAMVGVLAVIMSSADSHLNVSGVAATRDIALVLSPTMSDRNQLIFARIFTVVVGIGAIVLTCYLHRVIDFWIYCANFWMPVITAPMILYVCNVKTNVSSYIFSAAMGILSVILTKSLNIKVLSTCSPIIGMLTTMSIMFILYKISRKKINYQKVENCLSRL